MSRLKRKLHNRRVLLSRPRGENDLPITVYHVAFSPDSKQDVSGGCERTPYLCDISTGKDLRHFKGGVAAALALDGRSLICVSHDGTIRHRQIATGDLLSET